MGCSTKFVLEVLCLGLLTACFVWHVWGTCGLFLECRTAMGSNTVAKQRLPMPLISVCPGYRHRDVINEHTATFFEVSSDKDEATEEEIMSWWNNQTYSLDEIFTPLNNDSQCLLATGPKGSLSCHIRTHSSTSGKCATLQFGKGFETKEYAKLRFNMSGKSKMALFLHGNDSDTGFYWNYWPQWTSFFHITPGLRMDIQMKSVNTKFLNTDVFVCEEDPQYSYSNCMLNWLKKTYLNASIPACNIPQTLVLNLSLPFCLSRNHSNAMVQHLNSIVTMGFDQSSVNGCPNPCLVEEYTTSAREHPVQLTPQDQAIIYLVMETTNQVNQIEYFIHNLNSMVASLGGSLGLFLGFSCRGFVQYLLDNPWRFWFLKKQHPPSVAKCCRGHNTE